MMLCFPRWDQGWLCWIALTPLIAAIWFSEPAPEPLPQTPTGPDAPERRGFRATARGLLRPALLGYAMGLVFFWGAFSWLITVTGLGWFLLAFYMALYPACWGAFLGLMRRYAGDFTNSRRNVVVAGCGAAVWVAQEWMRGWMFTGFGWNALGGALHRDLVSIQIVEFTGIGGLSFLAAFTNLMVAITVRRFVEELRRTRIRPHWDFSVAMALIAANFAFGLHALYKPNRTLPETEIKVALVQPNIPEGEKYDPRCEQKIFDRLAFLTEAALVQKPQLLVWPESATPRGIYADEKNFNFVHGFAARDDYNFLLGTLDFDEDNGGHDYNIAALLTNNGDSVQIYRKIHLVPFGEYIPFRNSFPLFRWVIGSLVPVDMTPGTEPLVLRMKNPDVKLGALVCFEDTLGDLARQFVKGGAQVLVNVTNDNWFLRSAGAEQHLANAVFRAVENRRPLLRAANTGVTAIVEPSGWVAGTIRDANGTTFCDGVLTQPVKVPAAAAPLTFYTRHGELFSKLCAALAVMAFPFFFRRARR